MNEWLLLIIAAALAFTGCEHRQSLMCEPSTQTEAQVTYGRTRWCFARQFAFSKLVPGPGPHAAHENETQAFFDLASGTRLIYSEFLPGSGIKSFHGLGRLESIPELARPIYLVRRPAPMEHADGFMIVGFCGNRMFQVQAQGTNQPVVLADAVSLATNALESLRRQALAR